MLECLCGKQEPKRVSSCVDVAILTFPVTRLGNWEEIREELSVSNVLQRDSVLFAARLHPCMEEVATANENQAKDDKFWTGPARKNMIFKLLDEWILECEDEATVETLLQALSHEHFTDVKIRMEELINIA